MCKRGLIVSDQPSLIVFRIGLVRRALYLPARAIDWPTGLALRLVFLRSALHALAIYSKNFHSIFLNFHPIRESVPV